ncbi:hypothetical protein [Streptomyces sp. A1547]|uniref:hypothetical protein n=1 Tax=Streptomyces sp. A1547 TaxID=2563105 RepID=UPI00109E71A7|nr:hypothetical protein [Streptomyces sp. A1547]THA38100.1 hypothetical protein E6W17_16570 [Streptomyces sp. A1547]
MAEHVDPVADPETRTVRICRDRCPTCIFRPGNLMHLEPGRLAKLTAHTIANEGHIVCHDTLGTGAGSICAGYAAHPQGAERSLALRLVRAGALRATFTDEPTAESA